MATTRDKGKPLHLALLAFCGKRHITSTLWLWATTSPLALTFPKPTTFSLSSVLFPTNCLVPPRLFPNQFISSSLSSVLVRETAAYLVPLVLPNQPPPTSLLCPSFSRAPVRVPLPSLNFGTTKTHACKGAALCLLHHALCVLLHTSTLILSDTIGNPVHAFFVSAHRFGSPVSFWNRAVQGAFNSRARLCTRTVLDSLTASISAPCCLLPTRPSFWFDLVSS